MEAFAFAAQDQDGALRVIGLIVGLGAALV
jgi:hypothetical protein